MKKIIVSACLWGENVNYKGGNFLCKKLKETYKEEEVILVCPELFGGLSVPRKQIELIEKSGKRVAITIDGDDVTNEFTKGAMEVLNIAKKYNIKKAILKARSPSCGKGVIHSGKFIGELVNANGICAQLLIDNGIDVVNDTDL